MLNSDIFAYLAIIRRVKTMVNGFLLQYFYLPYETMIPNLVMYLEICFIQ
jgi:hypothetical protein